MIAEVSSSLSAFETAAGVSPHQLSILIRTFIFSGTLIWGCWCVIGLIHHARHHEVTESEFSSKLFRILVIVTIVWGLVFIA